MQKIGVLCSKGNKNNGFFEKSEEMKSGEILTLAQSDIFSGMSEKEIKILSEEFSLVSVSFGKHEKIFSPESYKSALAVILKGSADVYKETEKGPLFLSVLPKGAVFGMAALFFEDRGFINSVCAREDCKVLFISKEILEKIFSRYPVTVTNYITVLSKKIHYLNSKILFLTSSSPSSRLFSWLLNESEKQGSREIRLNISYSELALTLSMGRTSLYRSFDELRQQGRAVRQGKTVKLLSD